VEVIPLCMARVWLRVAQAVHIGSLDACCDSAVQELSERPVRAYQLSRYHVRTQDTVLLHNPGSTPVGSLRGNCYTPR
jgi:hypothetical protein